MRIKNLLRKRTFVISYDDDDGEISMMMEHDSVVPVCHLA